MRATRTDLRKLEATAALANEGFSIQEIMELLGISRRTYFYRLRELREIRRQVEIMEANGE